MATTYEPALPTPRDRARLLLGDTGVLLDAVGARVWFYQDETLDALIEEFKFAEAVAQAADGLCSRFAQEPDEYQDEGGVRVRWNERIEQWKTLAKKCRSGEIGGPKAGNAGSRYATGKLAAPGVENFSL